MTGQERPQWQVASGSIMAHIVDAAGPSPRRGEPGWKSGPRAACGRYPQRNREAPWFAGQVGPGTDESLRRYAAQQCADCLALPSATVASETTGKAPLRERDMLDRLAARYGKTYRNGGWTGLRHGGARHVRLHPGFGPQRIADFLAVDTWRSSGYAIHGHEVKVSRSDWLTELADPSKAEAIARFCTYWWLVVSDRSIVHDDLPAGWGLMAARGRHLTVIVQAEKREPEPAPPHLVASFARAIAHAGLRRTPD